jgi:cell division protein FtsI/penicillin-binding protein 2
MKDVELSWRYSFLGAVILVIPLLVSLQLIRIQTNPEWVEKLLELSVYWENEQKTIVPPRGQIYDRWGNLLAGNRMVYEVGVELELIEDPQMIAQTVSAVLGTNYHAVYEEILAQASLEPSRESVHAVLVDNVLLEDIEKLDDRIAMIGQANEKTKGKNKNPSSFSGLVYTPHLGRIYPEKTLASNIIGFVSHEGQEGKGYFGIEERFNDILAAKVKTVQVPLDPNRVKDLPEVPSGESLILTIDREIQRSMEEIIDGAVIETGSASGTLVVIDPKTGEIMALAMTPRMDLNEFWSYSEVFPKDTPFNRSISQAYEPGSVFKVLTMAAALDSGTVTPETVFVDTGAIEVGGALIYNWDMGAWGPQDMQGCLQHSLNVCLAWVATKIGPETLYSYLQAFGVGHMTGIDLAGEASGRLKVPGDNDWYAADLGTNAFGQGVSVTPVQMAVAVSAVANRGLKMAPKIVRSVANGDFQYDTEQRITGMPIKESTAQTLSDLLSRSLEKESSYALVTGYRVAGKTGTAEIPTPLGYTTNATNASFVGWAPLDDPRFLIYVWLEKPGSAPWGSVVAAPVFRQAVEKLVILLDIPPDDVRHKLNGN